MSYMSLLEKYARNTTAASLLNKMRHWLQERQVEGLSDEERQILIKSLDMVESKKFDQMVIYSLRGINSPLRASILPISCAFNIASKQLTKNSQLQKLRELLNSNQLPKEKGERESFIKLLDQAIQIISNSDMAPSPQFEKIHSKGL